MLSQYSHVRCGQWSTYASGVVQLMTCSGGEGERGTTKACNIAMRHDDCDNEGRLLYVDKGGGGWEMERREGNQATKALILGLIAPSGKEGVLICM